MLYLLHEVLHGDFSRMISVFVLEMYKYKDSNEQIESNYSLAKMYTKMKEYDITDGYIRH